MPHRRHNPLTGDWMLVSPQREARPWHGAVDTPPAAPLQRHEPNCALCPGNRRRAPATPRAKLRALPRQPPRRRRGVPPPAVAGLG